MPAHNREESGDRRSDLARARSRKDRPQIARLAEEIGDQLLAEGNTVAAQKHFALARRAGSFEHLRDRVRVVVKEAQCLYERGKYRESFRRLEMVLDDLERGAEQNLSARALGLVADVCLKNGRVRRAYRYATKARNLASRRGVGADALRISLSLGAVFARLGRWQDARALFEDVLSAARRSGDGERMGQAYNNLGLVHKNRCEWGRALDCFEQAIQLAGNGPERSLAERLNNLGIVHFKLGDWQRAEEVWRRALASARKSRHAPSRAAVLLGLGRLDAARGRTKKAHQQLARALSLAEAADDLRTQSLAREYRTELLLDTGHLEEASAELGKAKELADRVGAMTDLTAEIRRVQARLAAQTDSPARALKFISQGLETARRTGDRYEEAKFLVLRAEVRARQGNARAGTRFQQAIERLSQIGMRHSLAQTLVRYAAWMADTRSESSGRDRVQECLIVASEIYERIGDVRGLAEAQISLAEWKLRQGGVDGALAILRSVEEMDFPPEDRPARIEPLRNELEQSLVRKIQGPAPLVSWSGHLDVEDPGDVPAPADFLARLAAGVGADRALWVRPGQAGPDPRVVASINVGDDEAGVMAAGLVERRSLWAGDAKPVLSVSASTDDRFAGTEWIRDVRSVLLYPLVSDGDLQGLLYLDRNQTRGLPFGGREMEKVSAVRPVLESLSRLDEPADSGEIRIVTPSGVKTVPYMLGGPKLAMVLSVVGRVCNSSVPILIHGETGTGKELVAKALHALGHRQSGPFVAQNCAAIPRDLLESELFGHVSGAFTGAMADKTGLFEAANGGTFLLDEIAEMDAATQVKLLRLLETGEVRRLGAVNESSVDVRVVSATHRKLDEEVAEGNFREDLFYRLNVVSLELPPLRDRAEDVPLLASEFLSRSFAQEKKVPGRLSEEAMGILGAYSWPGNVRELENEMKRLGALASGGGTIHPSMLSSRIRLGETDQTQPRLREKVHSMERKEILAALEAEGWNLSRAARSLGNMPRSTLASRMKRLGIRRRP